MRRLLVTLVWVLGIGTALAGELTLPLVAEAPDQPPKGFRSLMSGQGPAGDWRILQDEVPSLFTPISPRSPEQRKRPVLAQLSRDATDERYLLLVYEGQTFQDFTLTTLIKLVDGQQEQMAGIAFRIQDEKNYYYIRASALGTNLAFFKMVDGRLTDRVQTQVQIPRGAWQELTIECQGTRIRGLLNGKELLLLSDTSGPGAYASGTIGYWTKSDAVSYFADTRVVYAAKETLAQTLVASCLASYPRLLGLRICAAPNPQDGPRIIASHDAQEIGQPAPPPAQDVIRRNAVYYGKAKGQVLVTLPLHDKNGDAIAAVKVVMKSFPGQTEQNAIARAMPIVKKMELRLPTVQSLMQ